MANMQVKEEADNSTATGEQPDTEHATPETPAKIWQVFVIALVSIAFTALFMSTYTFLTNAIWNNEFVTNNRWMIPVGVIFFSLLVGLTEKYLHAENVINGGAMESLKGKGEAISYARFPANLLSAFFSLLSGASVGPEGPVGFLVRDIAAWLQERLKTSKESSIGYTAAAMASAYNGIIGSPIFTAMLATEFQVGGKNGLAYLLMNLLAGVTGFLFYALLGLPAFAQFIAFTPITEIRVEYVLYAIILGVLGALIAIFVGLTMQLFGKVIESAFKDRVIPRILAAGVVISIVCYFVPELMFSGESVVHTILANPAQYGALTLLLLAIMKILLLGLSFKSGYLGGPIFPVLFACTMVGLALSLIFPGVPVGILVMCIEVAAVALALRAPLTAILLVTVIGTADSYVVALLVVATVTAMIVGRAVMELKVRRAAGPASA